MLSTQYWAVPNKAGRMARPVTEETMGIDVAIRLELSLSIDAICDRYSSAMTDIDGEWYATPVLSF